MDILLKFFTPTVPLSSGDVAFLFTYFIILAILSFYGSHRYQMAWLYYKNKKNPPPPAPPMPEDPNLLPKVVIQLPIFNEKFVIERLVEQVCQIRYPKEKLLIQVLDDSTDDTVEIASAAVKKWADQGFPVEYRHRTDRTGFKAGALQEGLKGIDAEFVAIFDADFMPSPDFLERTVTYFQNEKIGMVQTRWDHINRNSSLLTEAQGILLDGHFMIEHTARNRSQKFFNFNGTAGIWRISCIQDAGGWDHDTLTEDLDLSYRAQLKGWKFIFLNDHLAPAEIPEEMNAFKNQQHRWAKGSIQVALKVLPKVLKSNQPFPVKYEAFVHLTGNFAYVMMLMLSLMLPFILRMRVEHGLSASVWLDLPFFLGATVSVCIFYALSQFEVDSQKAWGRMKYLPAVLGLGIGLAVNNTKATLEAVFGHKSEFVRTPKLAAEKNNIDVVKKAAKSKYRGSRGVLPLIELFFGVYYLYTVYYCYVYDLKMALPFMMLFAWGFLYTAFMSTFQWLGGSK